MKLRTSLSKNEVSPNRNENSKLSELLNSNRSLKKTTARESEKSLYNLDTSAFWKIKHPLKQTPSVKPLSWEKKMSRYKRSNYDAWSPSLQGLNPLLTQDDMTDDDLN